MTDIRNEPIQEDAVVEMNTGIPGERAGFECAGCNGVSGLRYDTAQQANEGLRRHQENGHSDPTL